MRKIRIVLICLLSILGWLSCKKKTTTTPDPVIPHGMFAKINGVAWTATIISYSSTTGGGTNYIDAYGYDSTGKTIELKINNFTKRGTFNIPQANDSACYDIDFGVLANPVKSSSGQIAIQALTDTTVGGTFHFTAGSMNVTEGTFNVNFN